MVIIVGDLEHWFNPYLSVMKTKNEQVVIKIAIQDSITNDALLCQICEQRNGEKLYIA